MKEKLEKLLESIENLQTLVEEMIQSCENECSLSTPNGERILDAMKADGVSARLSNVIRDYMRKNGIHSDATIQEIVDHIGNEKRFKSLKNVGIRTYDEFQNFLEKHNIIFK